MNYSALPQIEADFQALRRKLIAFFAGRRLSPAEDYADEVFERVVTKAAEGEKIEDINKYVFGIAKFVALEGFRQPKTVAVSASGAIINESGDDDAPEIVPQQLIVQPPKEEEISPRKVCLRKCMGELKPEKRDLLIRFYKIRETDKTHVEQRKKLAAENGMSVDTLYTAICRLRKKVGECVKECCAA